MLVFQNFLQLTTEPSMNNICNIHTKLTILRHIDQGIILILNYKQIVKNVNQQFSFGCYEF